MSSETALRTPEVTNSSRKPSPALRPAGSSGQSAGTVNGPRSSSMMENSTGPPLVPVTPPAMFSVLGARLSAPKSTMTSAAWRRWSSTGVRRRVADWPPAVNSSAGFWALWGALVSSLAPAWRSGRRASV